MEEYLRKRAEFEQKCAQLKYSSITFTEQENQANEFFRDLIVKERAQKDDSFYKCHTLKHRSSFEKDSKLFAALAKLPKGAILHLHIDCCLDIDWFMSELAYDEHTYFDAEKQSFKYFNSPDKVEEGYKQLSHLRQSSADPLQFDTYIRNHLFVQEEDRSNTANNIWNTFGTKIVGIGGVLFQKDNFKKFLRRSMLNFIADGVLHVEARTFLKALFHSDGTNLTVAEEMTLIQEVIASIQSEHPHFTLSLIVQALKVWSLPEIEAYMREAVQARKDYPDLIVGFDLVMEEDSFKSTLDVAPVLLKLQTFGEEIGAQLPLVLHGGESLHTLTNGNLFDLLLLGTKRIGHGLNLAQHSYLLEQVKQQEICLEICPVSNQVLKYIDDIRLHPIKTFLNYGVKVCINPDDPHIFGYNGVTMDFFFTAIGTQFDYKDLKLCVYNSIQYSFLSNDKKASLWAETERQLQLWVEWFIKENPKQSS